MSGAQVFSFPTMTIEAIIPSISDMWDVEIDASSLAKPTPALVTELYSRAIEYLSGVKTEDMEAAHLRVMSEDPMDICSEAVSQQIFFVQLVARIDVQLSDLYDPDPNRTIKLFSALLNLCLFAKERSGLFTKLRQQSESVHDDHALVVQELQRMRSKLGALKAERMKEIPIIEKLDKEASELRARLEDANKRHIAAVSDGITNKTKRNELNEALKALQKERQVAYDTNTALKAQIVEEPERLRFIIMEMSKQASQFRQNIMDNEAKARDLRTKSDRAVVYEQNIREATQVLIKVQRQQEELAEATKKFNALKMDFEQAIIEKGELDKKHARTMKKLENAQARLKEATDTAQRKRETSEKAITRLREEYAQMSNERKENDADVEETKKEIEEVERQMAAHLRENEAQINEMLQEYARLRHQVDVYMEMLGREIGYEADL